MGNRNSVTRANDPATLNTRTVQECSQHLTKIIDSTGICRRSLQSTLRDPTGRSTFADFNDIQKERVTWVQDNLSEAHIAWHLRTLSELRKTLARYVPHGEDSEQQTKALAATQAAIDTLSCGLKKLQRTRDGCNRGTFLREFLKASLIQDQLVDLSERMVMLREVTEVRAASHIPSSHAKLRNAAHAAELFYKEHLLNYLFQHLEDPVTATADLRSPTNQIVELAARFRDDKDTISALLEPQHCALLRKTAPSICPEVKKRTDQIVELGALCLAEEFTRCTRLAVALIGLTVKEGEWLSENLYVSSRRVNNHADRFVPLATLIDSVDALKATIEKLPTESTLVRVNLTQRTISTDQLHLTRIPFDQVIVAQQDRIIHFVNDIIARHHRTVDDVSGWVEHGGTLTKPPSPWWQNLLQQPGTELLISQTHSSTGTEFHDVLIACLDPHTLPDFTAPFMHRIRNVGRNGCLVQVICPERDDPTRPAMGKRAMMALRFLGAGRIDRFAGQVHDLNNRARQFYLSDGDENAQQTVGKKITGSDGSEVWAKTDTFFYPVGFSVRLRALDENFSDGVPFTYKRPTAVLKGIAESLLDLAKTVYSRTRMRMSDARTPNHTSTPAAVRTHFADYAARLHRARELVEEIADHIQDAYFEALACNYQEDPNPHLPHPAIAAVFPGLEQAISAAQRAYDNWHDSRGPSADSLKLGLILLQADRKLMLQTQSVCYAIGETHHLPDVSAPFLLRSREVGATILGMEERCETMLTHVMASVPISSDPEARAAYTELSNQLSKTGRLDLRENALLRRAFGSEILAALAKFNAHYERGVLAAYFEGMDPTAIYKSLDHASDEIRTILRRTSPEYESNQFFTLNGRTGGPGGDFDLTDECQFLFPLNTQLQSIHTDPGLTFFGERRDTKNVYDTLIICQPIVLTRTRLRLDWIRSSLETQVASTRESARVAVCLGPNDYTPDRCHALILYALGKGAEILLTKRR
jgi:hypothetical protein